MHIDGEGGNDTIVHDVHAGPAATIDSTSATSTALVFSGTPHAGETWTVALSTTAAGGDVTSEFSHVATAGQTLPQVVQALAALINTSSDFAAGAEGMTLTVSLVSGGDLDVSASLLAATQAEVRSANAATTSVALVGTPAAGQEWVVIVDGAEFVHTVAPGESLEDVLDALAKKINASPDHAASVLSASMTILSFSGDALRVSAFVPQGASSTITPFPAQTRVVLLENDPLAGETVTVTVDGTEYSHVVLDGENLDAVLKALAGKIGSDCIAAVKDGALVLSGTAASMPVSAESLASAQAAVASVAPTSSLAMFEGVPHDGEVWSISLKWGALGHKATFRHTVSGNESLAQVLADLAAQVDGLEGYTAAFKDGLIIVTSIGAASVRLEASVPASAPRDIGFTADGMTLNGAAVLTHSGVESARNLVFTATSGADEIVLDTEANGRCRLSSSSGSFGAVTFDTPDADGSLIIRAGRGDDTITLDTSFAPSLCLSGGAGNDALNLGAATNSFNRLAFGSDFETVTGEGTVKDMVFNAYGADDTLSLDHYLALARLAVTLPFCVSPVGLIFAGRGAVDAIHDAVATDRERRTPNAVDVTRTDDGKIRITDTYNGTPHSVVVHPTDSLTINTGMSYLWAHDTVHVKDLGTVNFDLTVNAGRLNTNESSPGDVKFSGTTSLNGRDLAVVADTIAIEAGATVSTSSLSEAAGDICLRGHHLVLGQNSRLLAEGAAAGLADDGDILLDAVDNAPWRSMLVNVDAASVGVTVETGSVIRGRDVAMFATVDNGCTVSAPGFVGGVVGLTDKVLGLLDSLAKVELAVSVVVSKADIDIQEATAITSRNFTASASTAATSVASPLLAFLLAGSASVVVSDATVDVAGSITVSEDAVIQAATEQTVKAVASASAIKGISLSAAGNVVVSEATAHVADTAVLDVGGNLYVMADNTERLLTVANAQAGKDGIAGVAVGVSVEHGLTNAWLDGDARVDGNVLVSASMSQDAVPIKKALVLPMSSLGTWVTASTGSGMKGDIPEDLKSYLLSPVITYAKQLFGSVKSSIVKPSYGPDLPADFQAKADLAGSLAISVDMQSVSARIGDSGVDGDARHGSVHAGGTVSVLSTLETAPFFGASSSTAQNPSLSSNPSKLSGSLALAGGLCLNSSEAVIGKNAVVDSGGALAVDAQALSGYEFSWLWNLVTPWLEDATYTTRETDADGVTVFSGDTVEVLSGHEGGGTVGSWYEYIGIEPYDVGPSEDFSDEAVWSSINPTLRKAGNFGTTLVPYLTGDFGFSFNIANTWTQATASGEAVAVAGAATFLGVHNTAQAVIRSGAQINRNEPFGTGRDVAVSALSQSEAVNLVGNVNLPAISMAEGNPRLVKPKNLKDLKNFVPRLDKTTLLPSPGTSGQSGVGASLVGVYAGNTVVAKIEDGVVLRADTLQVTADNEVLEVNVGASGGSSKSFGLNGTAGANVVHSTTLAQIENGAVIDVGSGEILDPAKTDPADNGSVFVTARDSTWLFNVLGGVAVSEGVGVGASAGFNILVRDTRAVLGDIAPDASSGSRGSFTSGGNVRVSAENGGVSAALVVSGAVAKDAGDKDKADAAAGSGSGATPGSAGSNQADKDYADWRGKMANVLKEAKAQGKFSVNSDNAGAADATSDTAGQTSQNKTGVGVAASVAVNWADDDVRAYVLNTGPISLGASTLTVEALNGSGSISLAGGAALVLQTKSDPGGGFGGAFGLNVLYGATEAFMDGTAGLALGGLALNADRRGWTVSLAAGFAATSVKGTKGVSLAGSVGVNVTAFTTEAALRDVTGLADVSGDVILDADDTTVVVAVGGSVGFGGKAGFGAAMGVNVLANTTRSEIDGLTNFRHGGDLAVQARSTGIVVSATGSAGIAAGKEAGYGGAGTASVNVVANTIEANVLNVTETAPSSGDYVLRAGDFTGIFSFAGAIGAGKTFGGGCPSPSTAWPTRSAPGRKNRL